MMTVDFVLHVYITNLAGGCQIIINSYLQHRKSNEYSEYDINCSMFISGCERRILCTKVEKIQGSSSGLVGLALQLVLVLSSVAPGMLARSAASLCQGR